MNSKWEIFPRAYADLGALISTLIGAHALYEDETRNLLGILHAAFEKPDTIQPSAKNPSRTLLLLRHLFAGTAAAVSDDRPAGACITGVCAGLGSATTEA